MTMRIIMFSPQEEMAQNKMKLCYVENDSMLYIILWLNFTRMDWIKKNL